MKENTQEKSLVKVNENSIFYKIKCFFKSLFGQKEIVSNIDSSVKTFENYTENLEQKNAFKESIRNIENEETLILKLQKKYRSGEIKEEDLTQEQVISLCALYDKQISKIKKSNEIRKEKIRKIYNKEMKKE